MIDPKDLAQSAIETARKLGASYADARVVRERVQSIHTQDERPEEIEDAEDSGFGVRVIADGAWGFASSGHLVEAEAARVAALAVQIARASATLRREGGVRLAPEPPHRGAFRTPVDIDPFSVPMEDKIGLLLAASRTVLRVKGVKKAFGWMLLRNTVRHIATTEGAAVDSDVTTCAAGYTAVAVERNDARSRTYEPPPRTGGYEVIRDARLVENAVRVGEQAVEHLHAPDGPTGEFDLILDPIHLALTIHESVGHPTELDRVLGMEESLAGRSFATLDKVGVLPYGSSIVNFTADNTLPGGLATTGFDDDGVPGQKWNIIERGRLVGYSNSREVAAMAWEPRSRGSSRAESWHAIPIVRIPNLSLMPGEQPLSPEELIADTKDGIYIEGMGSYSIDQMRFNFQFGGDAFWRIRDGKRAGMLKNVTYQGITTEFWNSCDAICDRRFWVPGGILNCGKGHPEQEARMTHGAATARFRKVSVGRI